MPPSGRALVNIKSVVPVAVTLEQMIYLFYVSLIWGDGPCQEVKAQAKADHDQYPTHLPCQKEILGKIKKYQGCSQKQDAVPCGDPPKLHFLIDILRILKHEIPPF